MARTYLAWACWLVAFILPLKYAILETGRMSATGEAPDNLPGLFAFIGGLALVFIGYWLKDSTAGPKAGDSHGH